MLKNKGKLFFDVIHPHGEDAANTVAGVEKATVSFMTQKMKVEFAEGADPHATMENVLSACKKVEDDCEIFDI